MKLIEPYTTTHDSISAETGKNDGDGTSDDCISRTRAIDAICEHGTDLERRGITVLAVANHKQVTVDLLEQLPSVQPDIIRCKDCEYLCNEDGLRGMCWHINGFGTDIKDKYNSFCSWAERREDGH